MVPSVRRTYDRDTICCRKSKQRQIACSGCQKEAIHKARLPHGKGLCKKTLFRSGRFPTLKEVAPSTPSYHRRCALNLLAALLDSSQFSFRVTLFRIVRCEQLGQCKRFQRGIQNLDPVPVLCGVFVMCAAGNSRLGHFTGRSSATSSGHIHPSPFVVPIQQSILALCPFDHE